MQRLELVCTKYELTHKNFVAFLEGYSTEQSLKMKNAQINEHSEIDIQKKSALETAKKNLELIKHEAKSQKSQQTSSSKRNAAKLKLAEETAQLKCLEAKLMEEEKLASIQRRWLEVNTMLELNKIKQEVADEEFSSSDSTTCP